MQIQEGQVWHTYTTKIHNNLSLKRYVDALTKSKVYMFALYSDGGISYLCKDDNYKESKINYSVNYSSTGMSIDGHDLLAKEQSNPWFIYCFGLEMKFQLSHQRLFNLDFKFPSESVKIYLHPIYLKLTDNDVRMTLLPRLTVYADGIVQITFITLGNDDSISLPLFIKNEVNLASREIDNLLINPSLSDEFDKIYYDNLSPLLKIKNTFKVKAARKLTFNNSDYIDTGIEDSFKYIEQSLDKMTLSGLAMSIIDIFSNIAYRSSGLKYYFHKPLSNYTRTLWKGKPSVYIKEHTNQKGTSGENRSCNHSLINSIMTRVMVIDGKSELIMPEELYDHRPFDDYCFFNNTTVSLSLSSIQLNDNDQSQYFDFDNVATDNQVKNDLIEYVVMYYEYLHTEIDLCDNLHELSIMKVKITEFEKKISHSCNKFGEVKKYITTNLSSEDVKSVIDGVNGNFEAKDKHLDLINKLKTNKHNLLITYTFGLIASTSLSKDLLIPAIDYFNPTLLPSDSALKMVLVFPSTLIFILLFIKLLK